MTTIRYRSLRSARAFGGIAPRAAALLVLMAGAAVSLELAGCGKSDEAQAAQVASDRTVVRTQSFSITTVALGELESRNAIEIRNKVETRTDIVEIVPEGVHVKKGDLLVRLNSDALETQIQEETLRVESARADKIAAENALLIQDSDNASKMSKALLDVEIAKLTLQQWIDGDVKTREQALALKLERSDRELRRLVERVERSEKLYAQQFLSKDELERDRLEKIQFEADLKQAQLDLDVYKNFEKPKEEKQKRSDVEQAEAEVKRVELNNEKELASKKAAANNKAEQFRVLELKLAKYKDQLLATDVRAPADGLVVYSTSMARGRGDRFQNSGPLQVGREVVNNEMLISLPDTSVMQASVTVHESLAGRIRPGLPATIKIDALPGLTFSGKVDSVGIMAEQTNWRDPNLREYTVKVTIDPSEAATQVKPSMRAEARIEIARVTDAIAVPIQAVFSDGAVRFVYIEQGTQFARAPVSVGRRSDTLAEIRAGLTEGQIVLLREPATGEVIDKPWEKDQLIKAGYQIGDNGQPLPNMSEFQMNGLMPGGGPGAGGPGSGGPGAAGPGARSNAGGPGNNGAAGAGNGERKRGARGDGQSKGRGQPDAKDGTKTDDAAKSDETKSDSDGTKIDDSDSKGDGKTQAGAPKPDADKSGGKPASGEQPAEKRDAGKPTAEKPR